MRGKGKLENLTRTIIRITPAYAGKRQSHQKLCHPSRDHPRLCGEKPRSPAAKGTSRGSPPPMRGKVPVVFSFCLSLGITPAYAGKRETGSRRKPAERDHPRLCGEKLHITECFCNNQGSPPPMRGKDSGEILFQPLSGITPAYAGKSSLCHHQFAFPKDHPRLCGEKIRNVLSCSRPSGSHPPMRGKVYVRCSVVPAARITPAYAGKSVYSILQYHHATDHPRLCGEKLANDPDIPPEVGITPAYAGKRLT